MFKPELFRQLLRFAAVGTAVTLVFMGLNGLFTPRLGPDLAFLAAYPPAVALHFLLNKWWTFRDQGAVRKRQLSDYGIMLAVAFLIQMGVFQLLLHFTPMASWLASGVATVAQMAISFLAMQRRIFNGEPGRAG